MKVNIRWYIIQKSMAAKNTREGYLPGHVNGERLHEEWSAYRELVGVEYELREELEKADISADRKSKLISMLLDRDKNLQIFHSLIEESRKG